MNNISAWVVSEPVEVGAAVTKYYSFGGQRVAMRQGAVVYYLHGDHLGSTSLTTDDTGAEIGRIEYDPYGNVITSIDADPNDGVTLEDLTDRLFTGQRWDSDIELFDYRARFYDPVTGSFTQPDSIVPNPLDPRAWNRFGYVYGSPVNYTDPSGHIPIWDALDVASFGLSLNGFIQDPTLANFGWLALDTVGLLPILPGAGVIRRGAGALGDVENAASAARRVDGFAPGCAFNSFTGGTVVHTEAGLLPIEAVKVGDKVFALDPETGEHGFFEVVALTSHQVDELMRITIDGEVMEVTPEHPLYIEGKGWLNAEEVAIGDRLRRIDGGWATVLAIERVVLDVPVVVYNFTVAGVHTYFVLEVGVLVHNCSDDIFIPTSSGTFRISGSSIESAENARIIAQKSLISRFSNKTIAAIEGGQKTISGWTRRPGFLQATDEVFVKAEEIGHQLQTHKRFDQGVPGRYYASHAEKQMTIVAPYTPIGISRSMCPDCQAFFGKLAQHRGQVHIVADPNGIHAFLPNGRHFFSAD